MGLGPTGEGRSRLEPRAGDRALGGRLGAVSVEQIARRSGVGRSVAYEQVRRLVEYGLLERTQTAIGDPTLISATRDGITYAGLGLTRPTIRIGEVDHWLACADVAIELEDRYGPSGS